MYTKISDYECDAIKFSYSMDSIFEKCARKSAFNAKNLTTKEGKYLTESYTITEDEKDMFYQGLTSILPDIYDIILKITSGVSNAFNIESTQITLSIQDNSAYNENILSLVDSSIEECIIEGAMMEWYKNCTQADFLKLYSESYNTCLIKLYDRLFQMRKKKVVAMLSDSKI